MIPKEALAQPVFTVGILLTGSAHKAAPCFEGYREDQQTEIQAPPSNDITANGREGQSEEGLHCQSLYSHLHVTGALTSIHLLLFFNIY